MTLNRMTSVCLGFKILFIYLCFVPTQVATPRMDMTLAELQEMAARQQQQIEAQQQLLASKVCKGVKDERGEVQ